GFSFGKKSILRLGELFLLRWEIRKLCLFLKWKAVPNDRDASPRPGLPFFHLPLFYLVDRPRHNFTRRWKLKTSTTTFDLSLRKFEKITISTADEPSPEIKILPRLGDIAPKIRVLETHCAWLSLDLNIVDLCKTGF